MDYKKIGFYFNLREEYDSHVEKLGLKGRTSKCPLFGLKCTLHT